MRKLQKDDHRPHPFCFTADFKNIRKLYLYTSFHSLPHFICSSCETRTYQLLLLRSLAPCQRKFGRHWVHLPMYICSLAICTIPLCKLGRLLRDVFCECETPPWNCSPSLIHNSFTNTIPPCIVRPKFMWSKERPSSPLYLSNGYSFKFSFQFTPFLMCVCELDDRSQVVWYSCAMDWIF